MIPLYRPPAAPDLLARLDDLVRSGWWGYGPASERLEHHFTSAHGGAAVAVGSGTAALFLAAKLLNPQADDEVIVPSITFVSTAMAFHEAGFSVKIADVDPSTLLIAPSDADRLFSARTKAVVVVHLYGQRAETSELACWCHGRGIALVEDRAHRIGIGDLPLGDFACYSFNPMKEAPAGDGGLLWCRDTLACERARTLSNLGLSSETWRRTQVPRHAAYDFGGSSGLRMRMNDMTATFVATSMAHSETWRQQRREIYLRYRDVCSDSALQLRPDSEQDSYLMATCRVAAERRNEVRLALAADGIATSTSHYPSLSAHPLWKQSDASCPHAERAAAETLTLPMFPTMRHDDIDRVCAALKDVASVLS